jgi:hypothetical protein
VAVRELIPILQMATGPVILVSGVGLLLLCMTNRFGRILDRTRQLAAALRTAPAGDRARILSQLAILSARGQLVRLSITLAALSVLLAAILVIFIFIAGLLRLEAAAVLAALFIGCMALLIGSMLVFIRDINLSLSAVNLELASADTGDAPRGDLDATRYTR